MRLRKSSTGGNMDLSLKIPTIKRGAGSSPKSGPDPVVAAFDLLDEFHNRQGHGPFTTDPLAPAGFVPVAVDTTELDTQFEVIHAGLINHDLNAGTLAPAHLVPQELRGDLSAHDLTRRMAQNKADQEVALMKSLHQTTPAVLMRHLAGIDVLHQVAAPGRNSDDALYIVIKDGIKDEQAEPLLSQPALLGTTPKTGARAFNGTQSSITRRASFQGVFSAASRQHYNGRDSYERRFNGSWFPRDYRDAALKWHNAPHIPALIARVHHSAVLV